MFYVDHTHENKWNKWIYYHKNKFYENPALPWQYKAWCMCCWLLSFACKCTNLGLFVFVVLWKWHWQWFPKPYHHPIPLKSLCHTASVCNIFLLLAKNIMEICHLILLSKVCERARVSSLTEYQCQLPPNKQPLVCITLFLRQFFPNFIFIFRLESSEASMHSGAHIAAASA